MTSYIPYLLLGQIHLKSETVGESIVSISKEKFLHHFYSHVRLIVLEHQN